jgi:hypothetical protein
MTSYLLVRHLITLLTSVGAHQGLSASVTELAELNRGDGITVRSVVEQRLDSVEVVSRRRTDDHEQILLYHLVGNNSI